MNCLKHKYFSSRDTELRLCLRSPFQSLIGMECSPNGFMECSPNGFMECSPNGFMERSPNGFMERSPNGFMECSPNGFMVVIVEEILKC